MRLFIDECLSPSFPARLGPLGHDAVHPLHIGRRGQLDTTVRDNCIAEDRVIVTENVGDFADLLGNEPIHPGLIALPPVDKETAYSLLLRAIEFLERFGGNPMDHMVNHMLDFDAQSSPRLRPLAMDRESSR